MNKQLNQCLILLLSIILLTMQSVSAQVIQEPDPGNPQEISPGWADNAVSIGYITAPSVVGLMFISTLVVESSQGYFGIPAAAMILTASPIIYWGGRSATVNKEVFQSRARIGWTLYALALVPTGLALYGFTTDWGSTIPLTIASGVIGTASIVAMTTYAFGRDQTARKMLEESRTSWNFGIAPIKDGAIASFSLRF